MSTQTRALLIAMLGPALSALGAVWVLANVLIDSGRELTFRYVIFDPRPPRDRRRRHALMGVVVITLAFELMALSLGDSLQPQHLARPRLIPGPYPDLVGVGCRTLQSTKVTNITNVGFDSRHT